MDDVDVLWIDMLIVLCGIDKNDVINCMVYFSLLYKYILDDYIVVIVKFIIGWRFLKLIKVVQVCFNVNYDQFFFDVFFLFKVGINVSIVIFEDMIFLGCVDIIYNDNEVLYNVIDDVICKGGCIDNIVLLFKYGVDMMGRNGEIYERVYWLVKEMYYLYVFDVVNFYLFEDKCFLFKINYQDVCASVCIFLILICFLFQQVFVIEQVIK